MNGPDRRIPKRWTDAEDRILHAEAQSQCKRSSLSLPFQRRLADRMTNGRQVCGGSEQIKDWSRIAAKLPGRTNKDCRKRWINKVCGSLKKGAWSEDEDRRLCDAVRKHGQKSVWATCGMDLISLTGRQSTQMDIDCEHSGVTQFRPYATAYLSTM